MKLLLLFLACSLSAFAADTISDVSNESAIRIQTADVGIINAGSIQDVLKNYPTLVAPVRAALVTRLQAADPLTAQKLLATLQAKGVAIPAAAATAIANRVEAMRTQREAALLAVKDTDITRAKAAMDKLLADGLPITKATKDAVNAKVAPTPTPAPAATPFPTPSDGL